MESLDDEDASLLDGVRRLLDQQWRGKAACLGTDPALFHELAWNDDKQRAGPRLADALSLCRGCSVRKECAAANYEEPLGVWAGMTPPERRGELPLRKVMEDMRKKMEGEREPIPGAPSIEEIDEAYARAWAVQAEAYGGYLSVPDAIGHKLAEEHRIAHLARVGLDPDFKPFEEGGRRRVEVTIREDGICSYAGCELPQVEEAPGFCSMMHKSQAAMGETVKRERRAKAQGDGLRSGTTCRNGHDLKGTLPNGKPVLAIPTNGRPVCRLCKMDAAARHAERVKASKEGAAA